MGSTASGDHSGIKFSLMITDIFLVIVSSVLWKVSVNKPILLAYIGSLSYELQYWIVLHIRTYHNISSI
jgi:hypothetical protein